MDTKLFGRRLLELRLRQGFATQAALARRVQELDPGSGITQGSISGWESGDNEPRASSIAVLARALGVGVQELFAPPESARLPRPRRGRPPKAG